MGKLVRREDYQEKTYEKGVTLIELLAVIVILGIIAAIALPLIGKVIDEQRKSAFVANALTMKDASNLFLQKKVIDQEAVTQISYQELVDGGFLEEIQDPDTQKSWDKTTNKSYVTVINHHVGAVCLYGDKRNLCGKNDAPIKFDELSKDQVK